MGKFKPVKFGLTVIIISAVVLGLLFGVIGDKAIALNIAPPQLNSLIVDETGRDITLIISPKLPNVACWIKQETSIFTATDPNPITVLKSPFFQSNPFIGFQIFDITDEPSSRNLVDGFFFPTLEIKCVSGEIDYVSGTVFPIGSIDPDDPNLFSFFPNVETPLRIESATFEYRIYAQTLTGTWQRVFNGGFPFDTFDITSASPKVLLPPSLFAKTEFLEKFLPEGDFNSQFRFTFDGSFIMHWKETKVCTGTCTTQVFVIPVFTKEVFDDKGILIDVQNGLQVERTFTISGGTVPPPPNGNGSPECPEGQTRDPATQMCVMKPLDPCPPEQFLSGNVCVGKNGTDPTVTGFFERLQTCIESGDATCLFNSEFLPLYFFGLAGIVFIGAIAQTAGRKKINDIYGIPPEGFVGG